MAPPLKKLWVPSPEVAALMQEAVRASKAAAQKSEGLINQVLVLSAIRDLLNAEMTKLFEDVIGKPKNEG